MLVQHVEKVLWLIKRVKSGLRSFLYYWHFGQIILCCGAVVCIGRCLAATLAFSHKMPMAGDSWHTQNIHISKFIGENEKCVLYFMEKTKQTFWPTQYESVTVVSSEFSQYCICHSNVGSIFCEAWTIWLSTKKYRNLPLMSTWLVVPTSNLTFYLFFHCK